MRILRPEIWACDDCCIWLCNADLSGVDDEARVLEVQEACEAQGPHIAANFGSGDDDATGIREAYGDACDICGYTHSAHLHRFAELGEGPESVDFDGAKDRWDNPIPVANGSDQHWTRNLYLMWAGAYGDTRVFVWADSFDDAFEHLTEWLDDNYPGYLSKSADILADMEPEDRAAAEETGEIPDHTTIGHTTLENGDCIASWEWGGDEVTYGPTVEAVRLQSA